MKHKQYQKYQFNKNDNIHKIKKSDEKTIVEKYRIVHKKLQKIIIEQKFDS